MKLVELNPRWCALAGRHGQGFTFDCPHCLKARLFVLFENPLDGGTPIAHWGQPGRRDSVEMFIAESKASPGVLLVPPGAHWHRTGETFETLTLAPSVDASPAGHWHGFVAGGDTR